MRQNCLGQEKSYNKPWYMINNTVYRLSVINSFRSVFFFKPRMLQAFFSLIYILQNIYCIGNLVKTTYFQL